MFLTVIHSNYGLDLFAAVNTNFTFSCLVCFSWQYVSAVIRCRPRLLAFHFFIGLKLEDLSTNFLFPTSAFTLFNVISKLNQLI